MTDPSARDMGRIQGDYRQDSRDCPNCEDDPHHATVIVWENVEDWEQNRPPDYLGCMECNEMRELDERGEISNAE